LIGLVITVFVVALVAGALTGSAIAATGTGLFVSAAYIVTDLSNRTDKRFTAQQTQIDDLKRELEEMKGKMKE